MADVNENLATPSPAAPARLIVCEATGRWAVALRRELADVGVRVWETRTLADGWRELQASPASFAVLELNGAAAPLLQCLVRLSRALPDVRAAVVAERCWADYEGLFREAGAVHFLCSPRQVDRLARMACRHLAQVPPAPLTMSERIWSTLPWG